MTVNVPKQKPKTLRDELAIEAMRVLLTEIRTTTSDGRKDVAEQAYAIADAMIEARMEKR